MITATKLRSGVTFKYQGSPYRVIRYRHKHVSRGGGTVKLSVRNLKNGKKRNFTFNSREEFEVIEVERKELQYLYQEGDELVFMDPDSYEQISLARRVVGEKERFLQEGESVYILFWQEEALNIDMPPNVVMEVVECAPGEKGNSASNVYKDAVLEGEVGVRVPLFIEVGDEVRVDTRTGEYVERV